jgi:hypothetical protein
MSATLLANIPAAWPKPTVEATGLPEDNACPVNDPPNPPTEPEQRFAKTMAGLRRVIDAGSGSAMLTHEEIYDEVCSRADAGSTFALNQLAKILEDAHASADAGDVSAQIFLAKIRIKAAIWRFHEAVLRTDIEALFKLARLLDEFSSEDDEAQRWYNTPAANKHPEAHKYLKNEIELPQEKAQNDRVKTSEVSLKRVMNSDIIFKATNELLEKVEIAEQDCPEVAAPIAQIIEHYHRDPEALKTMLPAITNTLTTGAAMPEAGSFAQRVTESRASPAQQELPALPLIDRMTPLLAEEGFNERDRAVLAVKLTQIVDEARNPEKKPRRNARPAPTPEELRKAQSIVNHAKYHRLEPTDEIREARALVPCVAHIAG